MALHGPLQRTGTLNHIRMACGTSKSNVPAVHRQLQGQTLTPEAGLPLAHTFALSSKHHRLCKGGQL